MASPGTIHPAGEAGNVHDTIGAPQVSAILLDAGGVLVFPEPSRVLPPLRTAGVDPDLAALERAHYHAMASQDTEARPPAPASWWRNYLLSYVAACGVARERCELLATEMAQQIRGHGWTHVGLGVMDGLQAVAALGLPMGVVSNSDGSVEGDLRRLGVCHVPDPGPDPAGEPEPEPGIPMGVILDSAVVGVATLRRGRCPRGGPAAGAHGPVRVLPGARWSPARPQPGRAGRVPDIDAAFTVSQRSAGPGGTTPRTPP